MAESKTEKLKIITRIAKKMNAPNFRNFSHDPIKRAVFLTGLSERFINDIVEHGVKLTLSEKVDRSDILSSLHSFYLEMKTLPTTRLLYDSLHNKIPNYMDIDSFRKLLKKQEFAWKHIHGGFSFAVVEKPKAVFDRHMYLKTITEHRAAKHKIYFVDETAVDTTTGFMMGTEKAMKLSNHLTHVNKMIYAVSDINVHNVTENVTHSAKNFNKWMKDFMNEINGPSVIVIKDIKHHNIKCEKPNKLSEKIVMIDWLESKNIPYHDDMTRFELYDLIESHTNLEDEYLIDKIIEENGHTVLRIPNCIRSLTPAALFLRFYNDNKGIMNLSRIHQIPENTFQRFSDYIIDHEKVMMYFDLKVDAVLDELFKSSDKNMNTTYDSDPEVPTSGEDSD